MAKHSKTAKRAYRAIRKRRTVRNCPDANSNDLIKLDAWHGTLRLRRTNCIGFWRTKNNKGAG